MPFLCHLDSETVQDWIANEANDEPTCIWWEGDDGGPWATQCNELFNQTVVKTNCTRQH